jgi:predicted AlkP superfamily phosphohydrolase/phosphomutase
MAKRPVLAIGLDAAEPSLVERWMGEGHLPALARLRALGAYGRLQNFQTFVAETPWTTFLTGCRPEQERSRVEDWRGAP